MKRLIELVMFFGLATVLGTLAFRLYQSPDGKAIWDYFVVREPPPKGSEPAWMKNAIAPGFEFKSIEFPKNITFDGPIFPPGAFDWKNEPPASKREQRRNIKPAWRERLNARPQKAPSGGTPSGPWMRENPFAK